MKLNGRELKVIRGAIMVYLYCPLYHAAREAEESLAKDEIVLRALKTRMESRSEAFARPGSTGGMSWPEFVKRQLAVELEWEFADEERRTLRRALDACATELENNPRADVNIHFSCDDYGIRREHFEQLSRRLREEL